MTWGSGTGRGHQRRWRAPAQAHVYFSAPRESGSAEGVSREAVRVTPT